LWSVLKIASFTASFVDFGIKQLLVLLAATTPMLDTPTDDVDKERNNTHFGKASQEIYERGKCTTTCDISHMQGRDNTRGHDGKESTRGCIMM